jgi:hypothetical protein
LLSYSHTDVTLSLFDVLFDVFGCSTSRQKIGA